MSLADMLDLFVGSLQVLVVIVAVAAVVVFVGVVAFKLSGGL